ncbi:MAG: iron ABC transporter permease [Dehalococcoidia bacterium]|nr:iron ABC transporter permease [Dehalococcoidia bacterium]
MKSKVIIVVTVCLAVVTIGVAVGSVNIPLYDVIRIALNKVLAVELPPDIKKTTVDILWEMRLPRALLAFIVGGALSLSGVVMQSVLRNPLASSYTIGVSSGASLGAGIIILYGISIPFIGTMTLPLVGFVFGLVTILLAITFASHIDRRMENNTIILVGMVFSLFVNAITTLMSALSREHIQRLVFWQMGTFSGKGWATVFILAPIVVVGAMLIMCFNRELDIMTFGEEQAKTIGIDIKRVKWTLLIAASAITGSAIAFVGVIGFIDLVVPHVVRKLFGSSHRIVIPISILLGGAFMVICDLIARTIVTPSELPVGAITAIIGAPFFAYIYFRRRAAKC